MFATTLRTSTCQIDAAAIKPLPDRSWAMVNAAGETIHRYANKQAAIRAMDLHTNPQACPTCLHGCDCDVTIPSHGCGHYGCWGQSADLAEPCTFTAVVTAARAHL